MKLDNLDKTMEIIRKIYTCEIPMFDEEGDDWTEEYTDFYNSLDAFMETRVYINYWSLLYALRLREECMEKCIS